MTPAALDWVARFRRYMKTERRLSAHTDSNYARLVTLSNLDHFATPKDFRVLDAALEFIGAAI